MDEEAKPHADGVVELVTVAQMKGTTLEPGDKIYLVLPDGTREEVVVRVVN